MMPLILFGMYFFHDEHATGQILSHKYEGFLVPGSWREDDGDYEGK